MFRRSIRDFRQDTSGAVFIQVALMFTALCGVAGLAIDAGSWYASERKMQAAGDAAAIAGAYEVLWGGDAEAMEAAAKADATLNGIDLPAVTVNSPPSTGPEMTNPSAVEVIIQQNAPGFFSSLFMSGDTVGIVTRSVAGPVTGVPICLLALETLAAKGVHVSSSTLNAVGCMAHANSENSSAMQLGAGDSLTAEEITVVGDVSGAGFSPQPETGAIAIADPLAFLSPPTYGACDEPTTYSVAGGAVTLDPGVYCGGIDISAGADVTFEPGIYVIKDGTLKAGGSSFIHGDGVGFYLTGFGAEVDVSGGSQISFSAPADGEMAGLIFYQGPDSTGTKSSFSDSDLRLEGTLYFPDQQVDIDNGSTTATPGLFTVLVAQSLHMHSNASITLNSDYAASTVPVFPALGAERIAIYE